MVAIWLGVLLFFVGVLYLAARAIWLGRPSEWRARSRSAAGATLEPRERGGGFGLATNWPGLALIALGVVLFLVGSAG